MNFQSICRVCLSENEGMISIFQSHTFSECYLEISEVIINCASVQIHKFDGFSEYICNKCLIDLCLAYRFKHMCEESDYKFRNNLIVNNKGATSSIIPEEDIKIEYNNVNSIINEKNYELNTSLDDGLSQIKCEFDEEETQLGVLENQPPEENIDKSSTDITKLHGNKSPEIIKKTAPDKDDSMMHDVKINFDEVKYENNDISLEPQLSNIRCENQLPLKIHTGEKRCKTKTQEKRSLDIHYNKHAKEQIYKCEACSKSFSRKGNLNSHMRIHTGEKPNKCETCGQCFSRMHHLNNHMKIHTGEKPFKCDTCDQGFKRKEYLDSHMRIHTGEKPHKCETCGQYFRRMYYLNIHMKIHTNKTFICETCGQCFRQMYHLNNHLRIHTGVKPYECEICHKSFNEKCNLNKHIRIHTGEKPYNCKTCDRSFNQKAHLSKHMKIHRDELVSKCQ